MDDSNINEIKNSFGELEVKIEKYPWAISPLLIDEFFIMGYTEPLKKEKIIKPIISDITASKNKYEEYYKLKSFKNRYLPSALAGISSESKIRRIDIEIITDYAFPIPPETFYYIDNKVIENKEPNETNLIFNNINNQTVCNGYVYGFYEKKIIELNKGINLNIFYPKFFIVISQYNYFYTFHKICKYIHQQFLSDSNEIPLEIQIFNIVNFLPCPLNSKIELEIFARNGVLNCKTIEEFKNLGKNNQIFLDQLGAYKHSEINFGKIFEICSPELIVQILVLILSEGKLAFFHENLEIVSYVVYFFYQITFPITPKENIYCFSPNIYYYGDSIGFVEIIGFPCDFKKIEEYNPESNKDNFLILEKLYEIQRKLTDISLLKQYTIVNLMNGEIKFYEIQDDECGETEGSLYDLDEQARIDINKVLLELFKKPDSFLNLKISEIIYELYKTLLNLSSLFKKFEYFSFFIENDEIKKYSLEVQEAFFRFIVLFCNDYFNYQKKKKEKEQELEAKKDSKEINTVNQADFEKNIYSSFRKTGYNDILENMIGYYKEGEPLFMRASKKNFDNLMSICKADDGNISSFKGHFIDFLDCIFFDKNKLANENITFFEFFNYYNEKMKKNMFHLTNDNLIEKRKIMKNNEFLYYYKYKEINLSNDLIMKYNIFLNELDQETKSKIFPKAVKMDNYLYSKEINNLIDNFLINNKLVKFQNLLQFCVLSVVILSIPELKLMTFTEPIYNLFSKMNLQIRKYVELILNISYRYFSENEKINTKEEINQYFDIYKKAIDEKNLFSNDELTLLKKKFSDLIEKKEEGYNLKRKDIITNILNTSEDSLFILEPGKLEVKDYEDVQKDGKIETKISITGNLLENKEITEDFIYYPNTLFKRFNDLVYDFYKDLNLDKIRNEYYKLIINLMFYIRLVKDTFPKDTLKFLFYCLIQDKESIVKEKINNVTPTG